LITLLVIRYVRRHTDNALEESPSSP
jgi:hypothetical protein